MIKNNRKYYPKVNLTRKSTQLEKNYEQKFKLKNKIINHLMSNGNKRTSEKTLLQSMKFFQKVSSKNYKSIVQLAVINATPTFLLKDIKKLKKKRRKGIKIPFIPKEKIRISHSIKSIILDLKTVREKGIIKKSYNILTRELILSAQKKSEAVKKRNGTQEQALKRKKQLARFRWF